MLKLPLQLCVLCVLLFIGGPLKNMEGGGRGRVQVGSGPYIKGCGSAECWRAVSATLFEQGLRCKVRVVWPKLFFSS